MRDFSSQVVIEALRSGISSRHLADLLTVGREAAVERVGRALQQLKDSGASSAVLVKGNFGDGKTHFLNLIANMAQREQMVVSYVALSKETPFDKPDKVYKKLAAATYLPDAAQPGFERLLEDIRPGSDLATDLLDYAAAYLHPKIHAVLENYFASVDPYHQHLLYGDLAGDFLAVAKLKSLHRLGFGRALKMERFSKAHIFDYFRLLGYLFERRGYAGWVILFDEYEQIAKLGPLGRARAYLHTARFLSAGQDTFPRTLAVFSATPNLVEDVIYGKDDLSLAPAKLEAKGMEAVHIAACRRALKFLLNETVFLGPLSSSDVRNLLQGVAEVHGRAYGWEPAVDPAAVMQSRGIMDRLRTQIRAFVQYLDLKYLYGEEPLLSVTELAEPGTHEEEEDDDRE
ncbi:MAG: BREX system ATP-binding domain-containing protein [Bacillota bacterium]